MLAVTDPNIKNFSFNFDEKNPKIISTSPEINYYSDTFHPVIYPYLSRVDNLQKDTEISLPTIPNEYQSSWELRKINNYTYSSKPFICFREPYNGSSYVYFHEKTGTFVEALFDHAPPNWSFNFNPSNPYYTTQENLQIRFPFHSIAPNLQVIDNSELTLSFEYPTYSFNAHPPYIDLPFVDDIIEGDKTLDQENIAPKLLTDLHQQPHWSTAHSLPKERDDTIIALSDVTETSRDEKLKKRKTSPSEVSTPTKKIALRPAIYTQKSTPKKNKRNSVMLLNQLKKIKNAKNIEFKLNNIIKTLIKTPIPKRTTWQAYVIKEIQTSENLTNEQYNALVKELISSYTTYQIK